MSELSKACCTIPPIVTEGYEPKGKYTTVAGLKTYHTTSANPRASVLFIYDVFGFFPQTLQGADILAQAGNFCVYMPDWYEGHPADITWYPPDTPEKKEAFKEFFGGRAELGSLIGKAGKVMGELAGEGEKWGVLGLCYGGKVVSLLSTAAYPFSVAATAHPAMVNPDDALKITIPTAILASKDEDPDIIQKFADSLSVEKHIETFGDQIHGWMGARADLSDERCRGEFERGYKTVLEFFNKFI